MNQLKRLADVPFGRRVRLWWRNRGMYARTLAHERERAPARNADLRADYQHRPLILLGVVTTEVFLSDHFDDLARHIRTELPSAPRAFGGDRQAILDAIDAARLRTGGSGGGGAIYLHSDEGWGPRYEGLAPSVRRAQTWLSNFAPGFLAFSILYEPTDEAAEMLSRLFEEDHLPSVARLRGGVTSGTVEGTKIRALSEGLRTMATSGILPADLGLLGPERVTKGSVAIWMGRPGSRWATGSSVPMIMGLDGFDGWGVGPGERVYPSRGGSDDPAAPGLTWVINVSPSPVPAGHETAAAAVLYSRWHQLVEFHGWLALSEGAWRLAKRTASLRHEIEARRHWVFHLLWPRLGATVRDMDLLRYWLRRIEEIPAWYRDRADFPTWKPHRFRFNDKMVSFRAPMRQSVMDFLQAAVDEGLGSLRLILERADHLLQLRSANLILAWTAMATLIQLATLAISFWIAQHALQLPPR